MDTDRIRQRAYELWEQEGCPEGRDMEYWLRAERELAQSEGADLGSPLGSAGEGGGARSEPDLAATTAEGGRAAPKRARNATAEPAGGNGADETERPKAKAGKAKVPPAAAVAAERSDYNQQRRTRKKAEG